MENAAVRDLFLRALQVDPEARADFLASAGVSTEIRAEVESLLSLSEGAETFLKQTIASEQPSTLPSGRFGVYELRELIGRGGMGAVYRAERMDGELHQVAAVKVIERAWLDSRAVERFRAERQILASLEHPHIARLIDGGTREDGIPYLVMEYVEGRRIDEYCADRCLGIAERLRIFLPLCEAVEYAHRKLVVHRDLKPSNVLVTAEGQPKLLDFGVARVLDAESGALTRTLVLTPDFASPEQFRGEPPTTFVDVYGLGAVLYHLLTGAPPHKIEGLSPLELSRTICQTPPTRPSQRNPALARDLDNILLKALHPEPARRYRSAQELAADVERWLEKRPVLATPDSWWYRARRFVERRAIASAAVALAAVAIIAGTATSVYEAHRAQHRLEQVRELAGRFIFDFEKSIRDLPGALAARRMVAETAREYLRNLSADAGSDNIVTRELAEAHFRLSRVEIELSQSKAAQGDLEQAVALLKNVRADCCGPAADRLVYIRALSDLARQALVSRNVAEASAYGAEALERARAWSSESPQQPEARLALMIALGSRGVVLHQMGKLADARQTLTEADRLGTQITTAAPADDELAYEHARIQHFLAEVCLLLKDGAAAAEYDGKASKTLEGLVQRHPGNTRWRTMWAMSASTHAAGLGLMAEGDHSLFPQAIAASHEACRIAAENAAANPSGRAEADNIVVFESRLADLLRKSGRLDEAVSAYREAGGRIDRMVAADAKDQRAQRLKATNQALLGEVLIDAKRWHEAEAALDDGQKVIEGLLRQDAENAIVLDLELSTLTLEAVVLHREGHLDSARLRCRRAFEVAALLLHKDPSAEKSLDDLPRLRHEAKELGVPDPTVKG
jgi:eukaryotic-like serine/threonine-protein kinase